MLQERGVYFNMFPEGLSGLVMQYNGEYLKSCAKHLIHQEELPTFDLAKAPKESVDFLGGREFSKYSDSLREDYDKEFVSSPIAWEDYFASRAMQDGILEQKAVKTRDNTVYEQLGAYLAISPYDQNGQEDVYRRVGIFLGNRFPKRRDRG